MLTAPTLDTSSIVSSEYASRSNTVPSSPTPTNKQKTVIVLEAFGGTDKDESSHRRDTMPIVKGIQDAGCNSEVLQLWEESVEFHLDGTGDKDLAHDRARAARQHNAWIKNCILNTGVAGVVVRNNPGTLTTFTQAKVDTMLSGLDERGIRIMSHPEVQRRMGAKDALCKIRHLQCGLPDTDVYYSPESFEHGFRKSIAFRPRVMKQNRGSQGEGIWICKLKDEDYCENFGDKLADLDTMLILTEANDNHVEEHTLAEFIEFCVNGRTDASGTWDSKGHGRYLEGGIAAGAMLVDQRFLPRIVEGEVRVLMIGPNIVELVHKIPKAGGVSATLQSGAIYTKHTPDAPKFASLVANFKQDLPKIMAAFGLEGQPLPLLWTADYIFGELDADGNDTFYVGEFNCSCVGITQQLELATLVGETAVNNCFPSLREQAVSVDRVATMPPMDTLAMVKVVGIDLTA